MLLFVAACTGGDGVFTTSTVPAGGSTTAAQSSPERDAIDVVLTLPEDDVFALLDRLGDDDYFALLDGAGVDGDAAFVDALDFDSASLLVDLLDDATRDELLAIGAGDAPDPNTETTDDRPTDQQTTNTAVDVRLVETGALGSEGTIELEIGADDVSFLAYARTSDPEAQVFVTGVTAPGGVDVGDAIGLEYGELSNFGEAAFYAPLVESMPLEPGTYRVSFEATAEISESGAFVRSGEPVGAQALDVIFWMATTQEYDPTLLETRFREVAESVLGPHGITIGVMSFIDPPAAIVDEYAVLDFEGYTDSDLRGLCREMSSTVGPVRALNFAIVDELSGGGPDAIIEGSSSGLPGTMMLPDSGLSCVAGMAAPDPDDPARDLLARAIVIWHEAGHHLGLYHTTEEDGLFFDLIPDTPECHQAERDENGDGLIDLFECDGLDADNFMFYDGDGETMSPGQAWSIRRHPLLYPVGG